MEKSPEVNIATSINLLLPQGEGCSLVFHARFCGESYFGFVSGTTDFFTVSKVQNVKNENG